MSYLFRRNGIFYFRFAIPTQLRNEYGGKTEIRKSLKTFNKVVAQTIALYIAAYLKAHTIMKRKISAKNPSLLDDPNYSSKKASAPLGEVRRCIEIRTKDEEAIIVITHDDHKKELEAAKEILESLQVGTEGNFCSKPASSPAPSSSGTTLSELIEKYTAEQLAAENWSEKTAHENGAMYRLLVEVTGDISVNDVSHDHARDFKSAILKLPANMNKSPLYRNKSVQQILSMKVEKTMAIATVNKHLTRCGSLFAWAVIHHYAKLNPFLRMGVRTKRKANQERLPFDKDDLNKLFKPRTKYKHPYYYWMPLLGYYTGCRIEELCQLHTDDIKKINGIWVFDINEDGDKKLKTLSSERLLPIHTHLLDLGFLEFVQKPIRRMVFRELTKRRDGYSQDVSKWFQRFSKNTAGVIHERKSFHSFRHTVSYILKNAKVETKMIIAILGHTDRDISTGRYGGDYDPSVLSEAIETLPRLKDIIPYSQI